MRTAGSGTAELLETRGQPRCRDDQRQAPGQGPTLQQSYATLGLESNAGDQEVKRAYRKLVSKYHPDKLISQGLPDEMMEVSKRRVREINAAYDMIKASRGIK